MNPLYAQTIANMERTLETLARQLPEPVQRESDGAYRYESRGVQAAILQKLARIATGLVSAELLVSRGLLQDAGALFRMLDEFREDVTFLADALLSKETSLHRQYLEAFYTEEFSDPDNPTDTQAARPMFRQKIQAYLTRMEGSNVDPHNGLVAAKAITKAFSGYVHGASPHIMEMYGGRPPSYSIRGMLGTPLMSGHIQTLEAQFYRGIIAFAFGALAFGQVGLFGSILQYRDHFETRTGIDVSRPASLKPVRTSHT